MFLLSQISVLCAIVCISYITAAPVDVNNDTRPIVGVITPEEEKVFSTLSAKIQNVQI